MADGWRWRSRRLAEWWGDTKTMEWKYRWTGDLAIAIALLAMDEMDGCFPFHFYSWCCVQLCLYIGMTKTNSDIGVLI